MPIYEFKCLKCNTYNEILILNSDEKEIECSKCFSRDLERIISVSHFKNIEKSKNNKKSFKEERSCSKGSCITYKIAGPI